MAQSLPGHVGLPIIGDKSVEFYRDIISFVDYRIEKYKSRIFATRFLNKPTVFVTSNAGVQELLNDENSSFEMGYKQFMADIYGDNVIFTDGESAQDMRTLLQQLLMLDASHQQFTNITDRLTKEMLQKLNTSEPVAIYGVMKRLCTEICLTHFLDVDFLSAAELANQIAALTTAHWHGIVSVPLNVRIPMINQKTTFATAIQAKDKLLAIIEEKLSDASQSDSFPQRMARLRRQRQSKMAASNHVLLFTSALVPKALASLLTSFVVQMANRKSLLSEIRESPELLDHVLLEIQRLWPPFMGGRRIAAKATSICGVPVPRDHAVVYMTHHAQRDPAVFNQPEQFLPNRWREANRGDRDKLFVFGGGARCCVGQHMVTYILKTVCRELASQYNWEICPGQNLQYKWLPVTRPKDDLTVTFSSRK